MNITPLIKPIKSLRKSHRISLLSVLLIGTSLFLFLHYRSDRPAALSKEQLELFHQAQTLFREQKFDDALDRLKIVRRERENHLEIEILLAKVYFFTRDFQNAENVLREYLKKTIKITPMPSCGWAGLSQSRRIA
jgi:predicted Zn-dependent protease